MFAAPFAGRAKGAPLLRRVFLIVWLPSRGAASKGARFPRRLGRLFHAAAPSNPARAVARRPLFEPALTAARLFASQRPASKKRRAAAKPDCQRAENGEPPSHAY